MNPTAFVAHAEATYKPAPTLFGLIPEDRLDWSPTKSMMTIRELIVHLTARTGVYGLVTGDFDHARCWGDGDDPASVTPAQATARLVKALDEVKTLFAGVSLDDWERKQVEMPWGMKGTLEVMAHTLVIEHFLNHKMQLFIYLKLLGIAVDTGTLYYGLPPGKTD